MHAHTHFHARRARVSGRAPVIQVRAPGGWEMELWEKKGGKEIEMDGVGVWMKGTKGQDDYTTVAF